MKPKLNSNIILRIDDDMKKQLSLIQKKTGCSISEFVRQCLQDLIVYYNKNGFIILPMSVIPEAELQTYKTMKNSAKAKTTPKTRTV